MSQFIKLKQRIKTVETIKKTTHAMRLIAMSGHSRLRHTKEALDTYSKDLSRVSEALRFSPDDIQEMQKKKLVIFIGSQKGLCGNFNNQLLSFIKRHDMLHDHDVVIIGQQLIDLLRDLNLRRIMVLPVLSQANYVALSLQLKNFIELNKYNELTIVSNVAPSFFVQRPTIKTYGMHKGNIGIIDDLIIEDDPQALSAKIHSLQLLVFLSSALYESLLAEQAARFVSMDGATRNAENMLKAMKLDYNKLRQATITRELTDLVGSRLND